jgi:hypothetical protein
MTLRIRNDLAAALIPSGVQLFTCIAAVGYLEISCQRRKNLL